jgi:3',5'-cyclic AMP phosphodiesterase CpdA
MIRYLHLSDLHLTSHAAGGQPGLGHIDQRAVLDSLLKKIQDLTSTQGKLDFAVLSGDVAFGGKREEYEVAQRFCSDLAHIAGIPPQRMYIVPGNHDVDRSRVERTDRDFFCNFPDKKSIDNVLLSSRSKPFLLDKFQEFFEFVGQTTQRQPFDPSRTAYHFTDYVTIDRESTSADLYIIGLNSALFCGFDGEDRGGLALGYTQVDAAISQVSDDRPLRMVIMHHPLSCFHDNDESARNLLLRKADLLLTGHRHQAEPSSVTSTFGDTVSIAAGATYEGRASGNSFNITSIDFARSTIG